MNNFVYWSHNRPANGDHDPSLAIGRYYEKDGQIDIELTDRRTTTLFEAGATITAKKFKVNGSDYVLAFIGEHNGLGSVVYETETQARIVKEANYIAERIDPSMTAEQKKDCFSQSLIAESLGFLKATAQPEPKRATAAPVVEREHKDIDPLVAMYLEHLDKPDMCALFHAYRDPRLG